MLDRLRSPVEAQATVARPRHDVFRTIADPHTYPTWLVGAQRIRHVDPSFPAPSTAFDHSVGPAPGATVDDSSTALEADPPRLQAATVDWDAAAQLYLALRAYQRAAADDEAPADDVLDAAIARLARQLSYPEGQNSPGLGAEPAADPASDAAAAIRQALEPLAGPAGGP